MAIRSEEIRTKNYSAEEIKQALNESFNGAYFTFAFKNKKMYYEIKRFVDNYNKDHEKSPTSFDEVVFTLTGKHYVTNLEEYNMQVLRGLMDENGNVTNLTKGLRVWIKNKHNSLKKKGLVDFKSCDIARMIAILLPGATYVSQKKRNEMHEQSFVERLEKITGADGMIDFSLDSKLKAALKSRARTHGWSIEDEIRAQGYTSFKGIVIREKGLTLEEYRKNILECADANGNVTNLTKYHLETYDHIRNYAKSHKCSVQIALNEILGDKLESYTLIGVKNKLSKYRVGDPDFIGNDDESRRKITEFILSHMNENNIVSGVYKDSQMNHILNYIKDYNDITMQDAIRIFVPEAIFISPPPKPKVYTREIIAQKLKMFDDGSGCIDEARKNDSVMNALKKFAAEDGKTIYQEVEDIGGYYFTSLKYELDFIDYVKTKLDEYYGDTKVVERLSLEHPKLYNAVLRLRRFFPEGALPTIESTLNALGYGYLGGKRKESIFTEKYVREILLNHYGESRVIDSLYDDLEVSSAVITFSGKIGKPIKDTLEYLGYNYTSALETKRLNAKFISKDEYENYMKKSEAKGKSEPGDEE